jgi:YHS domain-containing protein
VKEKMYMGKRILTKMFFTVTVLLLALVVFYGCKKTEPQTAAVSASANEPVIEQKICPVMGDAINKNIYTEYKGKKVYFCTPMCKAEFEKNPEKYIGKLPQFAK